MSQQQNIYPVQLLNDLHNYFPDILYNSGRFRNVQDLLDYIRSVADTSPYARGQAQYNNRQTARSVATAHPSRQNSYPVGPPPPAAPVPPPAAPVSVAASHAPPPSTAFSQVYLNTMFDDGTPVTTTRVRMPLNGIGSNALMTTLLSGLFSDIMGSGPNLNTFLNERVAVYPTNEEIETATSRYNATRRQEDICAICQDDIEANQDMRRINHCGHYFHRDCIDTWFQGNVHCPTCRHDIREVQENHQPSRNVENPRPRDDNTNNNVNTNTINNLNNTASRQNSNPPPVPENHRRMNIRRPDNA